MIAGLRHVFAVCLTLASKLMGRLHPYLKAGNASFKLCREL